MPNFKKEAAVYDKEIVRGYDTLSRNKKVEGTWPRFESGSESSYNRFMDKIMDKSHKHFNPAIDENGIPVKGTGASHTVTDILRIKTKEGKEFLATKGKIKGYNSMGELITFHCSKPEIWTKTLFSHKREWDAEERRIITECLGPNGSGTMYELAFNEKNLKDLYNRRENDNINFVLKDEANGEARSVKDQTGISSKTLELFTKGFDYLWAADYLSPQTKAELRAEAQMRGFIPPGSAAGVGYTPEPTGTRTGPQKPSSGVA